MQARRGTIILVAAAFAAWIGGCGDDEAPAGTGSTTGVTSGAGGTTTGGPGGSDSGGHGPGGNGAGGGGTGGSTNSEEFPVTAGNIFSIQYRNSTTVPITVWLEGSQPPCSASQALACDSRPGGTSWLPSDYGDEWAKLQSNGTFAASGTQFTVIDPQDGVSNVDVSNRVDLQPGETLRIVPPMVGGIPEWYWADNGVAQTAGVKGWVTRTGIDMPASQQTLLYEYNLDAGQLWWDLSAVDGLNANATMTYEGAGCGATASCGCDSSLPKVCDTSIDAYTATNDGCPYIMQFSGADTCPNPKFYSAVDGNTTKPAWVVPTSSFTTNDVSSAHTAIWTAAGSPSGAEMAAAASGDPTVKPAYHIWWSTNPVGQAWLDYLQNNDAGACNTYGWAYDEKRWKAGDGFDAFGNPPDNIDVAANVRCDFAPDTYINIDVVKVM